MNSRKAGFRWPWIAPILIYAASGLEVIIMVTPFAAYFYSVYTPLLQSITHFQAIAWLPQFFLPHLARTQNLLFLVLWYTGPVLAVIGLIGFLACAAQLYYGKFVQKRLVDRGLYSRVRHPQYLCLAVSGLGFLLIWPRFVILFTYLMMLGVYYILARHEEEAVRARYGKAGERYMARVPMFNPFRGPRRTNQWRPPSPEKAFIVWGVMALCSTALAFLLRAEGVSQVYAVQWQAPDITAISFEARSNERIAATMQATLATPPLRLYMQQAPEVTLLMQITRGGSALNHLFTDLGMKAGAMQAIPSAEQYEYVVVSRVVNDRTGDPADPFALTSRIEPLYLVQPQGVREGMEAIAFVDEQFYPNFSRALF